MSYYAFTCEKCGFEWSNYPHKAKFNKLCGQCEKRKDVVCGGCNQTYSVLSHVSNVYTCEKCRKVNKMNYNLTEKQEYVVSLLEKNINMPTKDIIADYAEYMEDRDTISARHVQRVRKWYKENILPIKEKEKDVMDQRETTSDHPMFNASMMNEWEIDLLNMVNEGGWSIQQLAQHFQKEDDDIKNSLQNNKFLILNGVQIFDEKSDEVYWEPKEDEVDNVINLPPSNIIEDGTITVGPETNKSASHDDYWEVKIDCVTACSKVDQSVDVFMNKHSRGKAGRFMKWAKRREWLAYLIGELKEDGYYVYDLYLPDQRASQALVDKVVAEQYNQLKVIGVIHSHHEMGAGEADKPSFSGHDAEFINSNHNLSLLAGLQNGGFKIVGIARVKTPCGAFMQVKANVIAMVENPTDEEKSLKRDFFKKVFNRDLEEDKDNDSGSYHFTDKPTYGRRG